MDTRQRFFRAVDLRRNGVEDGIRAERGNAIGDSRSVDGFDSLFVVCSRHNAVDKERLNGVEVF